MKVNFTEMKDVFWLALEAENMQEAATLSRFGINGRQLFYRGTTVGEKGTFVTEMSFVHARRDRTDTIPSGSKARKK